MKYFDFYPRRSDGSLSSDFTTYNKKKSDFANNQIRVEREERSPRDRSRKRVSQAQFESGSGGDSVVIRGAQDAV